MHCRICDNFQNNLTHEFREVMYGTGDRFTYVECGTCGTFQIEQIPDLSDYYPNDYLSFELYYFDPKHTWARDLAIRSAAKYFINGRDLIGRIAVAVRPLLEVQFPPSLRQDLLGLTLKSRILDIGCGAGGLLLTLRHFGFENVTGVDPFIEHRIEYDCGVTIDKCEIADVSGKFDLVMFHHSLEHIADPISALQNAHGLLESGKYCLVRIPVVSSAWEIYRANWAQLDAPRHLSLFTTSGFELAAEKAGFTLERVVYDSTSFQFWGSEQILRGIPMREAMLGGTEYLRKAFGEKMDEWQQTAKELNSKGRGDQACFYLRRN